MGNAALKVHNWATHIVPGVSLFDAQPAANDTTAVVEVPRYKWIHCCNEGTYRGHHQGEFEMTRAVFEAFVRNFRDSPQYKAGSLTLSGGDTYTGGVEPVIQFDYEHASECPPWEGEIPKSGAPACGWALEVEIRNRADGKASLWAFAELGDVLREQIRLRQQRWVSIAFTLMGLHWITGKEIGPLLTSIAITNHPFMQDLEPLLASRRASQPAKPAVPSSSESPEAPGGSAEPTRTGATMDAKSRERLCKALKINLAAGDEQIVEAAEGASTGASNLDAVLKALGYTVTGDALKVIPELRDAQSKLAAAQTELAELLGQTAQADAQIAQTDVAAAMTAGKLGEGAKDSLLVYRSHLIGEETGRLLAAKRIETKNPNLEVTLSIQRDAIKAGREKFLSKHGVADVAKALLAQPLVAGPGGAQLETPRTLTIEESSNPDADPTAKVVDLKNFPGPNKTLRCRSWLATNESGFDKLPYPTQIRRASELSRTAQLQNAE